MLKSERRQQKRQRRFMKAYLHNNRKSLFMLQQSIAKTRNPKPARHRPPAENSLSNHRRTAAS